MVGEWMNVFSLPLTDVGPVKEVSHCFLVARCIS